MAGGKSPEKQVRIRRNRVLSKRSVNENETVDLDHAFLYTMCNQLVAYRSGQLEKVEIRRSVWINAPRERVWQAVTEGDQVAQWFFPGTIFSQEGNKITVKLGDMVVAEVIVEVSDPPRQMTTRNLPDMLTTTTYLLEEENGGTRFTVIEAGLESLSAEARQQRLDQNGKGWEMALENLKAYIDGKPLPRPEGF
jgi:uncharacterized protein YndB with AHSA1/START domain